MIRLSCLSLCLATSAVADPALAAMRPAVAALRALTASWAEGAAA